MTRYDVNTAAARYLALHFEYLAASFEYARCHDELMASPGPTDARARVLAYELDRLNALMVDLDDRQWNISHTAPDPAAFDAAVAELTGRTVN